MIILYLTNIFPPPIPKGTFHHVTTHVNLIIIVVIANTLLITVDNFLYSNVIHYKEVFKMRYLIYLTATINTKICFIHDTVDLLLENSSQNINFARQTYFITRIVCCHQLSSLRYIVYNRNYRIYIRIKISFYQNGTSSLNHCSHLQVPASLSLVNCFANLFTISISTFSSNFRANSLSLFIRRS